MKSSTLVLTVSLVSNIILFGTLLFRESRVPAASSGAAIRIAGEGSAGRAAPSDGKSGPAPHLWPEYRNNDFHALVDRLRAEGYPADMIRGIMNAAVEAHYNGRRLELRAGTQPEYWQNGERKAQLLRERYPDGTNPLAELNREASNLLRTLLGLDRNPVDLDEIRVLQRREFGDLSQEKIERLTQINSDYGQLRAGVERELKGIVLKEDAAKFALLQRERRADIEALLSPTELLEYDLRSSPSSHKVRSRLRWFDATEDEFRKLFALQKGFDDLYPPMEVVLPQEQAYERANEFRQLEEQFRGALGDVRYNEMKRAAEYGYGPEETVFGRFVSRFELSADSVATIESIQSDIMERARVAQAAADLSTDEKNAQLTTLATEASTKLTALLGTRGLEAYKQAGGYWVTALARPVSESTRSAPARSNVRFNLK